MAIYLVFSHIEQTTPDDYCAKYGSEYFFINLNFELLTHSQVQSDKNATFIFNFILNWHFTVAKKTSLQ